MEKDVSNGTMVRFTRESIAKTSALVMVYINGLLGKSMRGNGRTTRDPDMAPCIMSMVIFPFRGSGEEILR
jgi:hypothetical protein